MLFAWLCIELCGFQWNNLLVERRIKKRDIRDTYIALEAYLYVEPETDGRKQT